MMLLYCGQPYSEIEQMPASELIKFMEALPALIASTNGLEYDV